MAVWPRVPLAPGLTAALAVAALFGAASAGLDYLAVPAPSAALTYVERAAPLDLWGLLLVFGVVFAVVGWVVRFWPAVILAHTLLAGIYAAFGISALVAVVAAWEGNGWRTGASWLCLQGVVHLVLASAAWREWDKERVRTDVQ